MFAVDAAKLLDEINKVDKRLIILERYFSILQEKKDIEEMYKQDQLERITD